jgi:hypothetical protein
MASSNERADLGRCHGGYLSGEGNKKFKKRKAKAQEDRRRSSQDKKIPRKNPTKSTIKFAGLLRLKRVDYSVSCLVLAKQPSKFDSRLCGILPRDLWHIPFNFYVCAHRFIGSPAEWHSTRPKLGPSWGAAAFVLPITRKMRDGERTRK